MLKFCICGICRVKIKKIREDTTEADDNGEKKRCSCDGVT